MNLWNKISLIFSTILFSGSAFAVGGMKHIDVLGYGGYSQADQWSDAPTKNYLGTMSGFNGGGMLLVTLSSRILAPVIGAGVDYMQLKSSIKDPTNTFQYSSTLTSMAGTGHLGLRIAGPMVRLFLVGNAGMGLSDKIKTDIALIDQPTSLSLDSKMKNHVFYGGSAALLVSAGPFVKIGIMGVYNMHTTDLDQTLTDVSTNVSATGSTSTSYQEVSGNLVIDINL